MASNKPQTKGETMGMTAEQLNEAARILGTTDKNVVFSACIKTLVENGMSVKDAIVCVIGQDALDSITDGLWEELRASK